MSYTNEQIKLARSCKNANELIRLAKANNVPLTQSEADSFFASAKISGELSDSELENVSGGCNNPASVTKCPKCESTNVERDLDGRIRCHDCGY